jgi:hypothetical protein
LIWERTHQAQRLRHALREYFPAALDAFDDPDAADTPELLTPWSCWSRHRTWPQQRG